uniref:Cytotoxic T-lymphocyte protein 4 n=1 Tax=Sphenodon punctatus TaxID=8508 RepID=A0A8D0L9Q4_SPHPU
GDSLWLTVVLFFMEVTQPAAAIANRQGIVNLVCEYKYPGNAKEIRVALLKHMDNQDTEICASTFTPEYEMDSKKDIIQCHVRPSYSNVTFTLSGLQATDSGLYICKMERMYPAPYYMDMGNGTQLYVTDPEPCPDMDLYVWILGAVALGLFIYSILLTAVLVCKMIRKRSYLTPGLYVKMTAEELEAEKKVKPYHIIIN